MNREGVAIATLLARLPESTHLEGNPSCTVREIVVDSRRAQPGALFVALRGEHSDGHAFIDNAIANGACAVVVESGHTVSARPGVVTLTVEDSRRALSALAAAFYGDPSHALDVVGVTGTNGKTTTTRMIAAIADAAGYPCGVIGTVGAAFGKHAWRLEQTTPLPNELHSLLAQMRDLGARICAMEVSSHALALERVEDVNFSCAVLTNVTRDHLDFHGTPHAYAAAKRRLFEMARAAVLNADDAFGAAWAVELQGRIPVLTYGLESPANLTARDVAVSASGVSFTLDGSRIVLPLPARFNVENALAAVGVARMLGIDDAVSAKGLHALARVPGRMERLGGNDVDVIVDYAHTPDALEQALRAVREGAGGGLAVVFGCGGDRDHGKRPEMGAIAARFADRIYVTNDNPRTEEPQAIADAIAAGIGKHSFVIELDRAAAIERAIHEARPGDVVLIAGKGHEDYQLIGDRVLAFDDASVARAALARRKSR